MLTSSSYGLSDFNVLYILLHSVKVNHAFLTISVLSAATFLTFKIYLENVRAPMNNLKVTYETHRTQTHIAIGLIAVSSLAFNLAIYPRFGFFHTLLISAMVGYGVLFQLIVLIPYPSVQNGVGFIACTFFLQQYFGVGTFVSSF